MRFHFIFNGLDETANFFYSIKRRTSGSTSSLGPQVSGDGSSKSLFGRKLAKAQPSDAEVIDS